MLDAKVTIKFIGLTIESNETQLELTRWGVLVDSTPSKSAEEQLKEANIQPEAVAIIMICFTNAIVAHLATREPITVISSYTVK